MQQTHTVYKNSGKGRIAAITSIIMEILTTRTDTVMTTCVYHYYKYLKEYCKYDEVYYIAPKYIGDESLYKNKLNDIPKIIGLNQKNILSTYKVNDIFILQSSNNAFGGALQSYYFFNLNNIYDWYHRKINRSIVFYSR